jgi:SSS family solute:Na+ symporter
MQALDIILLVTYILILLSIGLYFYYKNESTEDYFVGGRNMGAWHIGLSVVATDVGGGFSIGLGGLGFMMGVSGSWLLFTGLLGAWLAAVICIPKIRLLGEEKNQKPLLTFPQVFGRIYGSKAALTAAFISTIGYTGFTGAQILAGAKLASSCFDDISINTMLLIMGGLAVLYTAFGGFKAVVYTDGIQWAVLILGLLFVGLPMSYKAIGGFSALKASLPEAHFSLAIPPVTLLNWIITIVPIWFVGMTLYQRIYACRSKKEAQKAWFIAGIFEWPIMAFTGVLFGMFARAAWQGGLFTEFGFPPAIEPDSEMGLPLMLRAIMPVGTLGLVMAAYFSAILSTADSCLMAASGNLTTDILGWDKKTGKQSIRYSILITLGLGILALFLAAAVENVLNIMLYSYSFMVSGLAVPAIALLLMKKPPLRSATAAMLCGGSVTVLLTLFFAEQLPLGLDPNWFGILSSAIVFFYPRKKVMP